ncbi:hypothetical protein ACJMK2_004282 [Sinanodonta woodiana]|uniref:SWIM-type domain-containing protein n=1 Tax=Sinanodonta woodiana TaxID=1069815 RepID=A0ABD3Y327_SINWO
MSGKINYKDGLETTVLERYMAKLSLIECLHFDDLKCYKLLESYNQFVNGWVKEILAEEVNNNMLVIAKVRHLQRMNDTPLKTFIIAQQTGIVETAHCDCMAGHGEACSHVGALLVYIETAVRLENTKTLFAIKIKPVVLAIMPKYSEHLIPTIVSIDLAKRFFELGHCEDMFRDIIVSAEQAKRAERLTRGQSECKDWHRLRTGRITAQRMKYVCTSSIDKPSISTITNICYPVKFSNKAIRWGCQHEKNAVNAYITKLAPRHDNLSIINPKFSHIGASLDALVSCNCCGEGTVEVKRLYCVRDTNIHNEIIAYMDKDNKLKTCHQYYYQSANIPTIASVLQPSNTNNDGLTVSENNTDLICLCQVPYDETFDDVLDCENHNYRLKWLHSRCKNMSRAPKGSYYCPECSPVYGSKVKKLKKC